MPHPGTRDAAGGWIFTAPQFWFGHRAEKWTTFYVCGIEPRDLPGIPFVLGEASHVIANSRARQRSKDRPQVSKREREATPPLLAGWLLDVARLCGEGKSSS